MERNRENGNNIYCKKTVQNEQTENWNMYKLHKIISRIKYKIVQSIVNQKFPCYYKCEEENMDVKFQESKQMVGTYKIVDIANWFLHKGNGNMEQKKLQKLCYYAQAWGLVFTGNKICNCEFEAWVHGPVNRELWYDLKSYGYANIEESHFDSIAKPIANPVIKTILEDVWATYGSFTGFELEMLTHSEEPWIRARGNTPKDAPSNTHICEKIMRDFYASKLPEDNV